MHVHANTTHTETIGSESVEETPRLEHVQHNHMKLEQIQLQLSEERDSGRGRTTDYRRRVTKKKDQPVERKGMKLIVKRERGKERRREREREKEMKFWD